MTTHTPSTSWGFGEHWIWVAETVTQRKPGESGSVSNMLATPWPTDSISLGLSFLSYKMGRCSLWSLNLGPSSWSSSNDKFKQVWHSQSPKCVYQEENHRDNQCNRVTRRIRMQIIMEQLLLLFLLPNSWAVFHRKIHVLFYHRDAPSNIHQFWSYLRTHQQPFRSRNKPPTFSHFSAMHVACSTGSEGLGIFFQCWESQISSITFSSYMVTSEVTSQHVNSHMPPGWQLAAYQGRCLPAG